MLSSSFRYLNWILPAGLACLWFSKIKLIDIWTVSQHILRPLSIILEFINTKACRNASISIFFHISAGMSQTKKPAFLTPHFTAYSISLGNYSIHRLSAAILPASWFAAVYLWYLNKAWVSDIRNHHMRRYDIIPDIAIFNLENSLCINPDFLFPKASYINIAIFIYGFWLCHLRFQLPSQSPSFFFFSYLILVFEYYLSR